MNILKPVVGNKKYVISVSGEIRDMEGKVCHFEKRKNTNGNDEINIEIYGKLETVELLWLALISHYEVDLPEYLRDRLFDIRFVESSAYLSSVTINGMMMVFNEPIYVREGYRLIPCFTNYAISEKGEVLRVDGGYVSTVNHEGYKVKDTYVSSRAYSAKYSKSIKINNHRLVALAWIPNECYVERYLVNHIDGQKWNNHKDNLEWSNYFENNEHAIETGLRKDTVPTRIRNAVTGEVLLFPGVYRAFDHIGINPMAIDILKSNNPAYLHNKFWEVRVEGDNRPWYYEGRPLLPRDTKRIYKVTLPCGKEKTFYDSRDLIKEFKLWNSGNNVEGYRQKLEELVPGARLETRDLFVTGKVEVRNTETDEVKTFDSMKMAGRAYDIYQAKTKEMVESEGKFLHGPYVMRFVSDKPWPKPNELFEKTQKRMKVIAYHKALDKERIFGSIRETSRQLNLDRDVINLRIKNGQPTPCGWMLSVFNVF